MTVYDLRSPFAECSGGSFFAYGTLRERASCQREQRDFVILLKFSAS
ncbi:hypothetical protein [Nostoc sp. C052]|nr:hypothetical protein [Nostoc sp. C052]